MGHTALNKYKSRTALSSYHVALVTGLVCHQQPRAVLLLDPGVLGTGETVKAAPRPRGPIPVLQGQPRRC